MRVIITGATGFIGRALIEELTEAGYEVIALSRSVTKGRQILGDNVTVVEWDGKSVKDWEKYADGARAIVNLAGESISPGRWTKSKKSRILTSRLDAGRAVVEAVSQAAAKPGVVVQSSGIGYYGSRSDEVVDESAPPGTGFLCDVARQWEASTEQVRSTGVRQVVIRTGVVLGADGGALPRLLTSFRLFLGGPLGSGKQFFPWIHLQDEVQAIRLLIERDDLDGPFNLVALESLTMRDFCSILGKVMRRPSWFRVPGLALRLLFGEIAQEVILSGQKAMPQRLIEAGYRFAYYDAESALRQILGQKNPPSARAG